MVLVRRVTWSAYDIVPVVVSTDDDDDDDETVSLLKLFSETFRRGRIGLSFWQTVSEA